MASKKGKQSAMTSTDSTDFDEKVEAVLKDIIRNGDTAAELNGRLINTWEERKMTPKLDHKYIVHYLPNRVDMFLEKRGRRSTNSLKRSIPADSDSLAAKRCNINSTLGGMGGIAMGGYVGSSGMSSSHLSVAAAAVHQYSLQPMQPTAAAAGDGAPDGTPVINKPACSKMQEKPGTLNSSYYRAQGEEQTWGDGAAAGAAPASQSEQPPPWEEEMQAALQLDEIKKAFPERKSSS